MYLPSAKSIVLSNDSILDFYRTHHLSMTDNYISKDSCFMDLGRIVQKLNEVYVYNSANHKLIFYDGIHCAYNKMILSNTNFETTQVEHTSAQFDSIMNLLLPISPIESEHKKYTAIIIWNKRLGIKNDDNLIEWENTLRSIYKTDIRIIKVNYDAHDSFKEPYKNQIIKMFNQMYAAYFGATQK